MEKVKEIPASPWDIVLLPVWVHKKLSVRIRGLIVAFLLIGLFDLVMSQNIFELGLITGEPMKMGFKLILTVIAAFVLGAVDVICTMVPIAEFTMMIGRRSEKYVSARLPVILMKSYALSHILFVIPYAVLNYSGINWNNVDAQAPSSIRLLFSFLVILINVLPYLQLGVIYRTFSVRTRIQVFGKLILLLATYFWIQISSGAIVFVKYLLERIIISF